MPVQHDKIKVEIGLLKKKNYKFVDIMFILIHVIFAYDYGFFIYQSRNMKMLTKICTVVFGLIINLVFLIFILNKITLHQELIFILFIVNHFAHILILTYFDKYTFCNFLKDLEVIDLLLDINSDSYGVGLKIALSIILSLVYKLIQTILYCVKSHIYCLNPMILQILCFITLLAHDIPLIVTFFTYHAVHFRLKKITSFIENKTRNILEYHHIYKALAHTTEKIKISFDIMVSMT